MNFEGWILSTGVGGLLVAFRVTNCSLSHGLVDRPTTIMETCYANFWFFLLLIRLHILGFPSHHI